MPIDRRDFLFGAGLALPHGFRFHDAVSLCVNYDPRTIGLRGIAAHQLPAAFGSVGQA